MDSVLIIGDEPDLRERLRSYLTEAGYEVTSVDDYMAAEMIIEDLVPDIIIMNEMHQNDNDSFAVCKRLHREHGIPVILLGQGPKGEMWKKAVAAGAEYYFKKPFSYKVLAAVVKAILRRYKGRKLRERVYGESRKAETGEHTLAS
ncbi:MAG: response regulator [Dehalococcoidia bacterium]|nr:response regulator [Dehalococcoidia bacterium]